MGKSYLLYFSEKPEPAAKKLLAEWFPELGIENLSLGYWHKGPDGKTGTVAAFLSADQNTHPTLQLVDHQEWGELPPNEEIGRPEGAVWVGTEGSVSPESIQRQIVYPGHYVTLADGNEWLIPAAQKLPHRFGMGEDGEAERKVDPRYQEWYAKAFEIMSQVFSAIEMWDHKVNAIRMPETDSDLDKIQTITIHDAIDFVCQSLAINYKLNMELIIHLGLLNQAVNQQIVVSTFDMPEIIEVTVEKKKEVRVSTHATSNI